ncbi:hypothetical protein MLD38_001576 [Melastoma candidum]|uniref:Uncharacterized protein n=1 Tax=Melastoma candidum TaxID=119954 RepID=A0ACB9SD03_9MYRT|nr:hypothetical protein MLD38_001576 [Melastoma candidum]
MARSSGDAESSRELEVGDELDHVPFIRRMQLARKCGGKFPTSTDERLSCVHDVVAVKEEGERRLALFGPGDSYQGSGGNRGTVLDFSNIVKAENLDDRWTDELDHIPLATRRKMLLLQKLLPGAGFSETCWTEDSMRSVEFNKEEALSRSLGASGDALVGDVIGEEKEKSVPICSANGGNSSLAMERPDCDIRGSTYIGSPTIVTCPSPEDVFTLSCHHEGSPAVKPSDSLGCQPSNRTTSSGSKSDSLSEEGNGSVAKHEEPNDTFLLAAKVKVEPSDHHGTSGTLYGFTFKTDPVKAELEVSEGLQFEKLDLMRLKEQTESFPAQFDSFECSVPPVSHSLESTLSDPPAFPMMASKRPRKRKKTATDSVETALEEDAPGLLKVLLDKGISVDDMKLYGEPESDDLINESCGSDDFAELEEVISKLFTQRQSDSKFGILKRSQDSKTSYCLPCLFSLVEQTQFLRMRKWPVEWGWCRDLQSFIFVFERHKRIVLERPEYGYATYFFELIDMLPIDWQIKRLVTAMKLTTYSRLTLLENKALLIGKDLTEGEAKVMMEYGWMPNTGLATMLNYCDRVVHDRKNEKNTSEWRAKIGKLLMDGYNGGTIVLSGIPEKAKEHHPGLEIARVKEEEPE